MNRTMAITSLLFLSMLRTVVAQSWTHSTFEDFLAGTAEDGGVNLYVTARGTVSGIYTFDYNRDGANDVLYLNSHDLNDSPFTYIYTNSASGLDQRHLWKLLNDGAYSGTAADLNQDGRTDLVLCGTANGMNRVALDAYIYYGTERGFLLTHLTRLPTLFSYSCAAGDLNNDGWKDLAFAQRGAGILIYWNSEDGFIPDRKTELQTEADYLQLVDVNRDQLLDLVAAGKDRILILLNQPVGFNEDNVEEITAPGVTRFAASDVDQDAHVDLVVAAAAKNSPSPSLIIFGGPDGFDQRPRAHFPTRHAVGCAVADLNSDGHSDIAFADQPTDDSVYETVNSLIYWGSPTGYDPARKLELPTDWATQCATGDLNGDGWPDLVFANKMSELSLNHSSFVYWGSPDGFDIARRTELPTHGPLDVQISDVNDDQLPDVIFYNATAGHAFSYADLHWNDGKGGFSGDRLTRLTIWDGIGSAAADLNLDGYVDLAIANSFEFAPWLKDQGSFVFWGSANGFSDDRKQVLRTKGALCVLTSDLNRDGWLDLIFSEWKNDGNNRIYWGGPEGFSEENTSALRTNMTVGLGLGDFDKDGWLDIAYGNYGEETAPIYFGSADGFSTARVVRLPSNGSNSVTPADLNRDGWLDLVYSEFNSGKQNDTLSRIYWGAPDGFNPARRTELPTVGAVHASVADLDRNGFLDICFSNESTGARDRTSFSYLYWNGPDGFDPVRRTSLFTNGGAGSVPLDFNADGWLDLAFSCHKAANGTHVTQSFLLWGGPEGFSEDRRLEFPTAGAVQTSFLDPGHSYTRRHEIGFVSGVIEAADPVTLRSIDWRAATPAGSQVKFQLRAADSAEILDEANWMGPDGPDSYYQSPGPVEPLHGKAFQYRALFVSRDGSNYPELDEVTLGY